MLAVLAAQGTAWSRAADHGATGFEPDHQLVRDCRRGQLRSVLLPDLDEPVELPDFLVSQLQSLELCVEFRLAHLCLCYCPEWPVGSHRYQSWWSDLLGQTRLGLLKVQRLPLRPLVVAIAQDLPVGCFVERTGRYELPGLELESQQGLPSRRWMEEYLGSLSCLAKELCQFQWLLESQESFDLEHIDERLSMLRVLREVQCLLVSCGLPFVES